MIRELLPPETGLAFEAMKALRTKLSDEATFVRQVDEVQRAEGYPSGSSRRPSASAATSSTSTPASASTAPTRTAST